MGSVMTAGYLRAETEGKIMGNVIFETTQGEVEIALLDATAPKACENFRGLVKKGYYDGLIFHRVIKNFMVQGGDPTGTGRGGESLWGGTFDDEFSPNVKFDKMGLLAMANRGPGTNGSQFFITTVPTPWLTGKHTIFGEVVRGYGAVQKVEASPVGPGDKPLEDQKIIKAYIKGE
ncbi:MAG: peptidylprolyl isomerase [Candidatus Omnitrophica bacterium]|nr:peptidylprolyl isomerase [Candidatus Omnitrophota bacterium]